LGLGVTKKKKAWKHSQKGRPSRKRWGKKDLWGTPKTETRFDGGRQKSGKVGGVSPKWRRGRNKRTKKVKRGKAKKEGGVKKNEKERGKGHSTERLKTGPQPEAQMFKNRLTKSFARRKVNESN